MTNREKFATVCIALILATLAITIVTLAMRFTPTYTKPYVPTFQYYVDAWPKEVFVPVLYRDKATTAYMYSKTLCPTCAEVMR